MPLFYQHTINEDTKLAVWKIEEPENFFLTKAPLQANITHPQKRLQHLAARYLLQYLFPNFPYSQILIAPTHKPFLPNKQYYFSLSHSGNYAAAIVSAKHQVGIDIEIASTKVLKVAHKFLNETEILNFKLPTHNLQFTTYNLQLTTLLWSSKETMLKWCGNNSIDFKKNLLLQYFNLQNEGKINATLVTGKINIPLKLQYKLLSQDLCLCWVSTKKII